MLVWILKKHKKQQYHHTREWEKIQGISIEPIAKNIFALYYQYCAKKGRRRNKKENKTIIIKWKKENEDLNNMIIIIIIIIK